MRSRFRSTNIWKVNHYSYLRIQAKEVAPLYDDSLQRKCLAVLAGASSTQITADQSAAPGAVKVLMTKL